MAKAAIQSELVVFMGLIMKTLACPTADWGYTLARHSSLTRAGVVTILAAMTHDANSPTKPDLTALTSAIARSPEGVLGKFLESYRWGVLAAYVHPVALPRGHLLISQGANDRNLYFLESGDLQVDVKLPNGLVRVALLGPGSVVGEGSFFSHAARSATVVAYSDAKVWEMSPKDFEQLSREHPGVALALSTALGAVLATRLLDLSRRIAVP